MMSVEKKCIGDQYQSHKAVMKGGRMIIVVFSKAGRVRCVSSKMLSRSQSVDAFRCRSASDVTVSYTKASADSTALSRPFPQLEHRNIGSKD